MFNVFNKRESKLPQARKIASELDFASQEAYNLLRTNIAFSLPKRNGSRLIGITSPNPQEGKSFTSINLAYSLAKDDHKVLLIDGDMRRPTLANVLSIFNSRGLSNLLVDEDIDDAVNHGVLHENLDVICSGALPPNPSELLGSKAMEDLMGKFREMYDFVIVDLPPVNAVADPLIASKRLDGTMLVIRHGYTRKKNVRAAIRQLRFAEIKILGYVYNGYSRGTKYYKSKSSNGYYTSEVRN